MFPKTFPQLDPGDGSWAETGGFDGLCPVGLAHGRLPRRFAPKVVEECTIPLMLQHVFPKEALQGVEEVSAAGYT